MARADDADGRAGGVSRGVGGPDWWRLAVGTLTAWPVAAPRRVDRRVAGRAMVAAPLAMAPTLLALGALAAALHAVRAAELLTSVLLLAALVVSCRAVHLDGLADLADGLSASYSRDRALEVMRRGDVGPSGIAAVVLVLLVDAAALASLAGSAGGLALAAVAVLASRHTLTWACVALPAARPGGLGATVAGSVHPAAAAVGGVVLLALALGGPYVAGAPWWSGPAALLAALGAAGVVLHRARGRLGGVTGDVLGACVELSLAAALAAGALTAGPLAVVP